MGNNFPSTLTYNADGRQVEIQGYDADLDVIFTTKIVWDGENELLETDENDVTKAVNTLQPAGYGNLVSGRRVCAGGSSASALRLNPARSDELPVASERVSRCMLYSVPLRLYSGSNARHVPS